MVRFRAHLTENYQLKACDKLLKETEVKLGAANAYIDELEDQLKTLQQEYDKLQKTNNDVTSQLKQLRNKYKEDLSALDPEIRETELVKSISAERDKWRMLYEKAISARDAAIAQIVKLQKKCGKYLIDG